MSNTFSSLAQAYILEDISYEEYHESVNALPEEYVQSVMDQEIDEILNPKPVFFDGTGYRIIHNGNYKHTLELNNIFPVYWSEISKNDLVSKSFTETGQCLECSMPGLHSHALGYAWT